jgi:hypothetical protein
MCGPEKGRFYIPLLDLNYFLFRFPCLRAFLLDLGHFLRFAGDVRFSFCFVRLSAALIAILALAFAARSGCCLGPLGAAVWPRAWAAGNLKFAGKHFLLDTIFSLSLTANVAKTVRPPLQRHA